MFDVTKIQDKLYGAVGFRQPLNPAYPTLTAGNLTSRSGRFVTDEPYVKIEYLYDNQDYKDLDAAQFNTELENMQKNAISEVCGSIFSMPDFIDRQVLYKNANNKTSTVTLPDGFVGYKIQVENNKNIAFEIKRVFLEFEGAGDITLMLFNSAVSTPIHQQTITISSSQQVEELNWKVDNTGNYYKGEFYLGYRSNDGAIGTLKPYARDYESADIMSCMTHLYFLRIYFPGVTTNTIPDLSTDEGLSEDIGVNPDIIIYEDYTDLIMQNETLLSYAIYLQLAIKCASHYLASLRSNRNERESERVVLRVIQQIEGQDVEGAVKIEGLRPKLTSEMMQIRREIEKQRHGLFPSGPQVHTLQ